MKASQLLLLAKSGMRGGEPITVGDHTQEVMDAATALFGQPGQPTNLGQVWCDFFSLDADDVDEFLAHVRAAAFCHDWGKANDGFQQMVQRRGPQLLRHEQVSAILMCWPSVWAWLETGGFDVPLVLSAVVGHHLKCREPSPYAPREEAFGCPQCEVSGMTLPVEALTAEIAELTRVVGLRGPFPDDVPTRWQFDGGANAHDLEDLLGAVLDRLEALDRELRRVEAKPRLRMLWAMRAALVAADAAGSALPREGKSIREWIRQCVRFDGMGSSAEGRMTGDTIRHHVIRPRIKAIKKGGKWCGLNSFQAACGDAVHVPDRALLLAPCGSGKTLAAWRWIAARLDEHPRGRAIFLYPTRGTATEGYRDYAALAGDDIAALMHGTADLDLDDIAENAPTDIDRRIDEARLANPDLNWLRDVALAVVKAGRDGDWLRAHELADICDPAGVSLPGRPDDEDLDDERVRDRVLRAVGRKMGRCFDENVVEIDGMTIERREGVDRDSRARREYRILHRSSRNGMEREAKAPATPHAPPMRPACAPASKPENPAYPASPPNISAHAPVRPRTRAGCARENGTHAGDAGDAGEHQNGRQDAGRANDIGESGGDVCKF